MSIDYLPDEMNAYAKGMKLPEISEFYRGWRAACEAMNAKAHPQPAPDWRAACVVEKATNGRWDAHSPSRRWWWDESGWVAYLAESEEWEHSNGRYGSETSARAALAACPTPPPDAAEAHP
jgi:hypothetical protein